MTAGADHLEACVSTPIAQLFEPAEFVRRHIGPSPDDMAHMLDAIGAANADELLDQTVPDSIRSTHRGEFPISCCISRLKTASCKPWMGKPDELVGGVRRP